MAKKLSIKWPKVTAAVTKVCEYHKSLAEETKQFKDVNLRKMIEKLKKLKGKTLIEYADKLSAKALHFMLGVMHLEDVRVVLPKIASILSLRYRSSYCRTLWKHINNFSQIKPMTTAIAEIMDQQDWSSAVNKETEYLLKLSFNSDDFLKAFTVGVLKRSVPIARSFKELNINPDSELARQIRLAVILHGNRGQLLDEGTEQLVKLLREITLAVDTDQAYFNYLASLKTIEWDEGFMLKVERDLVNNEHRYKRILEKLDPTKALALRKRINIRSIKDAFTEDDERLAFWLKFSDDLANQLRKIPLRGAGASVAFGLDFGKFGVVEFSAEGGKYGAAYFYWNKEYVRVVATYSPIDADLKQYRHNGYFFRDRNDNRMWHSGDWQRQWTNIVRHLIQRTKR